jgi:transposase-like protein
LDLNKDSQANSKRAARKRAGRKPGQKPYSQNQRSVALTIVDLFDGNVARAAQATGIERKTLFNWRQELEREAIEMQTARSEVRLNLVAKLKRLAEALCAIALMKAQSASIGEVRQLIDVVLDKIERLSKVGLGEAALNALVPSVEIAPPKTLPPSYQAVVKKEHRESIVRQVIEQSAAEGRTISRDEAIVGIIQAKPEAKDYLM